MLNPRTISLPVYRSFKNFGHKPQPEARITTIWHGFLTFMFIGCFIDWKWITNPLQKYYKNTKDISPME